MDSQLEFSSQAFSKMVMHAMKYPHSVCCGLLLSPKPSDEDENDNDEENLGEDNQQHADGDTDNETPRRRPPQRQQQSTIKIIETIPISHTSHYLAPNIEVALNSVSIFAQEQELVISGYYQTDKNNEACCLDTFGQRVTEKIAESYSNAVLCSLSFSGPTAQTILDLYHFVDGKWRSRPAQSFSIENDPEILAKSILYSKEKLYRKIVDFEEHFNNISLDWTNPKISQRIDYLVANIC